MLSPQAPMIDALRTSGVSAKVLFQALNVADDSGRQLRDVLLDEGLLTELELAEALAQAYGLKCVDLMSYAVDAAATAKIPVALARRHRVLGISLDDDEIVVAISDPGDVLALDDVRAATGLPVQPVVVPRDELNKAIERLQRAENDLDDVAANLGLESGPAARNAIDAVGGEAPIVRFVNSLIERAIDNRASDLHIEPGEADVRVRFRIDGVLHDIDVVPRSIQSALISRLKIMASVDITERRVPQNGRITVELNSRSVDLRLATLPTVWGEKIVLRVLDTGGIDLDLSRLGFSARNHSRFAESFGKPHGMLLVTGPTGSGKSTTLYSTLTEISKPEVNIITVEDPVEYRLPGVNQVQVNHKAGLTFAAVLPAILRSDPDVVLIGEIRDRITAQLAIEASLTGHLVLSTLHTNDAPSALTRLIEMGIEPFLVGSSLDCVMAQRLARRLCTHCRQAYTPAESDLAAARWPHEHVPRPQQLWRAAGCRSCSGTGYRGRVALHEVMPVSEEIERLAVARASSHEIQRVAIAEGMDVLRTDGLRKVASGETTLAEVLRVAI